MNRLFSSSASVASAVIVALGILGAASPASAADPPHAPAAGAAAAASSDPAAAQALFYEARNLMKENKFGPACAKLEESLRLDYGIGTEFNLADCNEKLGRVATAWSGFLNVASSAKTQNQPQREKVARERAKALEPRLPKLTIEVVGSATPGLEVKRDGVTIGGASWGTAVPVDPGTHRITASAPGRQAWEGSVTASEAKVAKIMVPQLAASDQPAVVAAVAPVSTQQPDAQRPQQMTPFPEPVVDDRGSTQRTIGWIVGGAGVAAVGVGAGFGIDSLQKRDRAKSHCTNDECDPTGLSLRRKAMNSGDVATIVGAAGGAAILGGIVLLLTAPRGNSTTRGGDKPAATGASSIKAVPHVAVNSAGISIQGVLP